MKESNLESFTILMVTIFVMSVMSGTLLYLLYEDTFTTLFPSAVTSGVLAPTLTWCQSVKISWIISILFKTTEKTYYEKEKQ
jgi:hypothetical protein